MPRAHELFVSLVCAGGLLSVAHAGLAQTTAPVVPPPAVTVDDTPSFKVGTMLFADYTFQSTPTTRDSDGNAIHASSFNVSRAYINVTGRVNHWILFRVTPEAVRETGAGSSLNGSQNFRLKFAFAQFNLDDWAPKGTWVRLGIQQTPLIDYEETIYRYRFQGPVFVDREGYVFASDAGVSGHVELPNGYGDVHAGFYNGDGFNKVEPNDQKAIEARVSFRPFPKQATIKGLRFTAFFDGDNFVKDASRQRLVGQVTFESPRINAGLDHITTHDRISVHSREMKGSGWSGWATPRLTKSWEVLLRHDDLKPDDATEQRRTRNVAGVAYWFPNLQKASAALMLDYDSLEQKSYNPVRARDTRYGAKILLQF